MLLQPENVYLQVTKTVIIRSGPADVRPFCSDRFLRSHCTAMYKYICKQLYPNTLATLRLTLT